MRKIVSVEHLEFFKSKDGKQLCRTHAIVTDKLGNLEEAVGFGKNFKIDDCVEFFHDQRWNVNKMRLPLDITPCHVL